MKMFKFTKVPAFRDNISTNKVYMSNDRYWHDDKGTLRSCPFDGEDGSEYYKAFIVHIDFKHYFNQIKL